MELTQIQNQIANKFLANAKRDNIEITDDYLLLKITEELGEFIQSYLVHHRKCRPEKYLSQEHSKIELAKELSDVLGLVFVISKKLDINIEEALTKKWLTGEWIKKQA